MNATSKYDLEHTYEFVNHGKPWTRPDGDEVVGHKVAFRATAAELPLIEAEPTRFEHVRTLPFPPVDAATPLPHFSGMQRTELPQDVPLVPLAAPEQPSAGKKKSKAVAG